MSSRTRPRITPGGRRDLGPVGWTIAAVSGRVAGTGPPNLFTTMGRHRRLYLGWLRFAGRMMPGGRIPRRETELVILRVAHVRACEYEFTHHVRLGRRAGLTPDDIDRVVAGPDADGWNDREHAMLSAADQLLEREDLDDRTWTRLRAHLDERECIELILLVGHYRMLAAFITTVRIEPDEER